MESVERERGDKRGYQKVKYIMCMYMYEENKTHQILFEKVRRREKEAKRILQRSELVQSTPQAYMKFSQFNSHVLLVILKYKKKGGREQKRKEGRKEGRKNLFNVLRTI
jgi:hypothetical protein